MICSIQSIFQEAEASLPFSPWDPPEIHWKPEGMLPKNFFLVMVCFLQTFIEPWEPNNRLHGIPGEEPLWGRAGKRRWKGAGTPCRENGVRTMIFYFISERMVCLWQNWASLKSIRSSRIKSTLRRLRKLTNWKWTSSKKNVYWIRSSRGTAILWMDIRNLSSRCDREVRIGLGNRQRCILNQQRKSTRCCWYRSCNTI